MGDSQDCVESRALDCPRIPRRPQREKDRLYNDAKADAGDVRQGFAAQVRALPLPCVRGANLTRTNPKRTGGESPGTGVQRLREGPGAWSPFIAARFVQGIGGDTRHTRSV